MTPFDPKLIDEIYERQYKIEKKYEEERRKKYANLTPEQLAQLKKEEGKYGPKERTQNECRDKNI